MPRKIWLDGGYGLVPAMTKLCIPPAPDAITYLVKCKCAKERCSTKRCQCRRALAGLNCTDLCICSDNGKLCESMHDNDGDDGNDDDDEARSGRGLRDP